MIKPPRWLFAAFVSLLSTLSFAQVRLSDYSTYTLDVTPYRTQYKNVLTKKDIELSFDNLAEVNENADLFVRVDFIEGLRSRYLLQTAIPGTGFAYRVQYKMPTYRVSIVDKNGILILQKIYGGENRNALFGEFESISSVEDLKFEWETNRQAFFAKLESQPEEVLQQKMDEELALAVQEKNQEIANEKITTPVAENTDSETPEAGEEIIDETRKKPTSRPSKANVNIYRRPDPIRNKAEDPSEPKISPSAEQLADLNGFIEVDACSKYSYQLKNKHPFATLTIFMQQQPENIPEEINIEPGQTKLFDGIPHKHAWLITTYQKDYFQEDQILAKEDLNFIASDEDVPRLVTTLLDQFFAEIKPEITFTPKFDSKTDEVTDFVPENSVWEDQLRNFLTTQTVAAISKGQQDKIVKKTEHLLTIRALKTISEKIEGQLANEDKQKLIYPIIKASENFRNISPLLGLEYSQSFFLDGGINEYWHKQKANRIALSFRLPFEWQLNRNKLGALSTLHVKASFESLLLDFNQTDFMPYALDPEGTSQEPEMVLSDEQFSIQTSQLSAGIAWKLYFPLPILEVEAGAFFSNKTRLLWGEDKGQFPRNLFSPENEIISDVVDLSSFRPYFGAKIGIPFYFSGYKFNCASNLRNVHLSAGFRMYPVDFAKNDNYNVFIRDPNTIEFLPIPLEDGKSKFLTHLMLGLGVEF